MNLGSKLRRRTWLLIGLGLIGLVGLGWMTLPADPWPPRLVISPPMPGMAWGYSPDGRWFRTSSAAGLTRWGRDHG